MVSNSDNFIWVKEFGGDALSDFYKKFKELEEDPLVPVISIIISSYGGSVYGLIGMRNLIKSSRKPVMTLCLTHAQSAGAFLLAAGSKQLRFAAKDTDIMIHGIQTWGIGGDLKQVGESVENLKLMQERVLRNLAEDTGKSYEEVVKAIHSSVTGDINMTPEQALEFGIIDAIGMPQIDYEQQNLRISVSKQDGIKPVEEKPKKRVAKKSKVKHTKSVRSK